MIIRAVLLAVLTAFAGKCICWADEIREWKPQGHNAFRAAVVKQTYSKDLQARCYVFKSPDGDEQIVPIAALSEDEQAIAKDDLSKIARKRDQEKLQAAYEKDEAERKEVAMQQEAARQRAAAFDTTSFPLPNGKTVTGATINEHNKRIEQKG